MGGSMLNNVLAREKRCVAALTNIYLPCDGGQTSVRYLLLAKQVVKGFVSDRHWGFRNLRVEFLCVMHLRKAILMACSKIFSGLLILQSVR